MIQPPKLTITTVNNDELIHEYKLSGQIDGSAGVAFDALSATTLSIADRVILDFAEIERINSMGLAQLMKLLEQWRLNKIQIEVRHLNRMVSMLFKMTGLTRYFSEAPGNAAGALPEKTENTAENTTRLRQIKRIRAIPEQAESSQHDKLVFSVGLQGGQQLTGWYVFNTFLQRHLEKAIHLDVRHPGQTVQAGQTALVFAKPFEACTLITEYRFIPLARPINDSDEVSVIVRQDDAGKIFTDFSGASVVTAVQTDFVYLLGRFLCDEYGLDSSTLQYVFTGNEIKALRFLLAGQADILFMPKKNYHQLSRLSREGTCVLEESETAMAYHMLLVSPYHIALKTALESILLTMPGDEKGAQILTDLGLNGWCVPEEDELAMLLMLYQRYAGKAGIEA